MDVGFWDDIRRRFDICAGRKGFYYRDLHTGETFGICEDEAFLAASVIKLPIFAAIMRLAAGGEADLEERLTIRECQKLPGCGALSLFTEDLNVNVRTLCRLMIAISDNTATNALIHRFGMNTLQQSFSEMGLEQSRLNRLLFDGAAAAEGRENTISPGEMGMLLEQFWNGSFVDTGTSKEILETLLLQQIGHKMCGRLGETVPAAHKTGEDDDITNDVGIVCAQRPFVVCYAYNGPDVPEFEQLIRDVTWEIYRKSEEEKENGKNNRSRAD